MIGKWNLDINLYSNILSIMFYGALLGVSVVINNIRLIILVKVVLPSP